MLEECIHGPRPNRPTTPTIAIMGMGGQLLKTMKFFPNTYVGMYIDCGMCAFKPTSHGLVQLAHTDKIHTPICMLIVSDQLIRGQLVHELTTHETILFASLNQDGTALALATKKMLMVQLFNSDGSNSKLSNTNNDKVGKLTKSIELDPQWTPSHINLVVMNKYGVIRCLTVTNKMEEVQTHHLYGQLASNQSTPIEGYHSSGKFFAFRSGMYIFVSKVVDGQHVFHLRLSRNRLGNIVLKWHFTDYIMVYCDSGGIYVHNIESNKAMYALTQFHHVLDVAWSGNDLCVAEFVDRIHIVCLETNQISKTFLCGYQIHSIAAHPSLPMLAGATKNRIRIWDTRTTCCSFGVPATEFNHDLENIRLKWTAQGTRLMGVGKHTIRLWK